MIQKFSPAARRKSWLIIVLGVFLILQYYEEEGFFGSNYKATNHNNGDVIDTKKIHVETPIVYTDRRVRRSLLTTSTDESNITAIQNDRPDNIKRRHNHLSIEDWLTRSKVAIKYIDDMITQQRYSNTGSIDREPRQMRSYFYFIRDHIMPLLELGQKRINICETGFMAGHSAAAFLEIHPFIHYYGWDIGNEFSASVPMAKLLAQKYGDSRFNMGEWGDSKKTLPDFVMANPDFKCDIISVDGEHSYTGALADLRNFRKAARKDALLFVDDCCTAGIFAAAMESIYKDKLYTFTQRVQYLVPDMPDHERPSYSQCHCIGRAR